MKKFLKSSLSLILAITLIFSSAYVGLSEIDFDKGAINSKFNNSNFDIHSVYDWFGELDFSSNLAIQAEAADYSDLTPNEYMTRVLLNYKYCGYLNDYGASDITYQNQLLKDYYYFPDEVSSARRFHNAFKNDNDFQSTLELYKRMTFDFGDAVAEKMELEDYYTAIILNIINAKFQDDNFIDSLNCETNKNIVALSNSVADILKENAAYDVSNLMSVPMTILTDEEAEYILDEIIESVNHKNLYKLVGRNVSAISDIMFYADNVNDAIKNICAYTSIANTCVALENVLYEIYNNCPSTNVALKAASYQIYKYISEEMGYAALTMISAGESAIESGIKVCLSSLWDKCLTNVLGSYASYLKLGQVIGKGIGNFCCGTDKILEQLVVIGCLVDFEDVMISAVKSIENDYKNSWTVNNADNYIKAVELLLATYDLDCQYSSDFITLVYTGGVLTSIKYSKSETLSTWLNAFQKKRANIRWGLIRFPDYAGFFEKDSPSGYDIYFGNGGQNNGDHDSFVPQYITLNNRSIELAVNMSATLTATISPVNPNHRDTIIYYSSDDSVVSVDVNKGIVSANSPGTATITAIGVTVSGSIRTTCNVTVLPFSVSQNDTGYTIVKYLGSATNVSIPREINGIAVTSIGDGAFRYSSLSCIRSPNTIAIPDSVTTIGNYAFYYCNKLETITIPDSVTSIGDNALAWCENLASVSISNSVKNIGGSTFYKCTSLTSITIPNSVTNIGDSAFKGCENIVSIVTGDNVTVIGDNVFDGCKNIETLYIGNQCVFELLFGSDSTYSFSYLTTIFLGDRVTNIISHAFSSIKTLVSVSISDSVTYIGDHAFYWCANLKSIAIPNSVTYIGNSAFGNCDSLTSITIPDSVTTMGDAVFDSCDNLITAYIGNGVTSIGDEAFAWCENLESVTIGNNVTRIGDGSFECCVKLTSLELPDSVKSIGKGAFIECYNLVSINVSDRNAGFISENGVLFDKSKTTLVYCPAKINAKSYVIPETVTTIYAGAFSANNFLETIIIPGNVKIIGDYAFSFAQKLKSVTIKNGVKDIGLRAFYYCPTLTSVIVPDSVTSIGDYAFCCCFSLATVKISDSITRLGEMVFGCCETLTSITIPETVTFIGVGAFAYCTNLTTINIPNNVTTIGGEAFASCTSLTSITIPDSVTYIGRGAFHSCENLVSVTIPDKVPNIAQVLFYNCKKLTSIIIPNNVACIEYSAFSGCTSLISITIPDSVTSIERRAFNNCTALQYVLYSGSESDWTNISIDNTKNESLTTATIHYNATDHSYEEIIDIEVSCKEDGLMHKECTVCGLCLVSEVIASTGHKYSTEWTIDKVATCTENGLRSKTCLVCGSVVTEEIEKTGHSYSHEWTIDVVPTCTENGSKSHHCTACGDKVDITVIIATGHYYTWENNYEDLTKVGTCTSCSEVSVKEIPGVSALTITANTSGTGYTIAEISNNYSGEVEIPEMYNGLPVTAISADAFRDCTEIASVVIPDTVTSIGGSAFRGCTNLEELVLPVNITSIPGAMCFGCTKLETVVIPENVVNIGGYAFSGCTTLKTAVIPDSVTNIGGNVFANCNSLIVLSGENSAGHTYSMNNNISFIANNDNTVVNLSENVILTNCLNSDIADIMASSHYLTYSLNSNVSGTGVLVDVMKDGTLHSQYTLVVNGDTDGDSVCDALDCFDVERAANGNTDLSGVYAMAADSNSDDVVDITDYQSIVNKALAS